MEKIIKKLTQHIIVCGAGFTGMFIIKELLATKTPFLVIDENCEDAHENDAHQDGQHQHHHPGLGGQNLLRLQVELADHHLKACTDLYIPVDIQEQGENQGDG